MIAADTSLVVAAFASWHEGHASALAALERSPRLPAHVVLESFSVLTRLPTPHRAPADLVTSFLKLRFPDPPLALAPGSHLGLLAELAAAGFSGGSVYDAVVAATAREAGATLLSRDRRAARIYDQLGTRYELLT